MATTRTQTPTATASQLAAEAAEHGDLIGCALILAGLDWSHVDLTDAERAKVEQSARADAEPVVVNRIATREQYVALFRTLADAVAHEEACLEAVEFLPAFAVLVRAGANPTPEYWQWLADQIEAS